MSVIKIHIDKETKREIKNFYNKSDRETIEVVVDNILTRYLNVEYFNPELNIEEQSKIQKEGQYSRGKRT